MPDLVIDKTRAPSARSRRSQTNGAAESSNLRCSTARIVDRHAHENTRLPLGIWLAALDDVRNWLRLGLQARERE
jgi:hypothetical protein